MVVLKSRLFVTVSCGREKNEKQKYGRVEEQVVCHRLQSPKFWKVRALAYYLFYSKPL
jgi:hypothetical protein